MTRSDTKAGWPAARGVGWRRPLRRLGVDLRPGEGSPAALLFVCFFLIVTFQYTTKTVRQSTFIESLGAQNLPLVYLFQAICSYPILLVYARLADRLPRHHLIAGTCGVVSASMLGFWWLFQLSSKWVPALFYIWVSIIFVMTVSQFWSFANHELDPRQAKRLFGFIGAGGLLGGVAGGQVAALTANVLGGTYNVLFVAAAIILTVFVLIYVVQWRYPASDERVAGAAGLGKLEEARGGFGTIRRSRHLQLIAGLMTVTVVVAQMVDLQFNWAAQNRFGGEREILTAFYGNFYSVMGISAFVFQLLFTARIHRTLGVGFAMRVLPGTMGAGTIALLVAASFFPGGLIVAAGLLKIGENGLRYSLDQATRELLFLPVPSRARLKAKAFIDVFVQRGAKGLAALLLLPVTFGLMGALQVGWISLVLILVWLGVIRAMRSEYVRSFRQGLRQRTVDAVSPINVNDVTTMEILVESLGSRDPRQVLHSLELLASHDRGNLVSPLLLYHDDPTVRLRTLQILAEVGRADSTPLVERCLGDDDPEVRAEAIRVLAQLSRADVRVLMLPRLRDPDYGVRAAAVASLADQGDDELARQAESALLDMLSDADTRVRAEAARAIGSVREPKLQGQLVTLLYDRSPQVAREAVAAVRRRVARDGFNPIYAPILISMMSNRRLKHDVREALAAFGEPAIPVLAHFMNDPQEQIWIRRALPKTLAPIGTDEAVDALVRTLAACNDRFLKRKVIEALGTVDPPLLRGRERLIREEIRREAKGFLQALVDLVASGAAAKGRLEGARLVWSSEDEMPTLLDQLLAERMASHLRDLFGLLALIHPPSPIWAAYIGLTEGSPAQHSHALEFLDNTLSGEVRRAVFATIDDTPLAEKLRVAERHFGATRQSRVGTLDRYLRWDGDEDRAALIAAAVYSVYLDRLEELYGRVEELMEETDGFVRETATWVAGRLGLPRAQP